MKVNWENEKETLEKLIKEGVSYERIGKQYDVSGTAVKKAAKKLGIELEQKRKINPNEHFNKGKCKKRTCLNCGNELKALNGNYSAKFCSLDCQKEYRYKVYIQKWQNGEVSGNIINGFTLSTYVRRFLLEKNNYKCEKCGFSGTNPYTNLTILQIHHIDGDSSNNNEDNLQVLCPNCHAMTDNYGSRNKNATKGRTKYFGKDKFKKYE